MDEQTRLSLWIAFSRFFLDTELNDSDFAEVAKVIRESGVTRAEAESVLWNEVFPVLSANLHAISGEWVGWSPAWLQANLRPSTGPARRRHFSPAARAIKRCWQRIYRQRPAHRPQSGLLSLGLQLGYAVCLLFLWVLGGSPQDWMTEFDPSLTAAAIEDRSGDRNVALGLLLLLALGAQVVMAIRATTWARRLASLLLAVFAVLLFSCQGCSAFWL